MDISIKMKLLYYNIGARSSICYSSIRSGYKFNLSIWNGLYSLC